MKENILRWFGHVMKKGDSEVVKLVIQMNIKRKKEDKKKKIVKYDMKSTSIHFFIMRVFMFSQSL